MLTNTKKQANVMKVQAIQQKNYPKKDSKESAVRSQITRNYPKNLESERSR